MRPKFAHRLALMRLETDDDKLRIKFEYERNDKKSEEEKLL